MKDCYDLEPRSMVVTAEGEKTSPSIIYRPDVENKANKGSKIYFGLAETPFKGQFRNHDKDFNHEQYRKSTELSKYVVIKRRANNV